MWGRLKRESFGERMEEDHKGAQTRSTTKKGWIQTEMKVMKDNFGGDGGGDA